MNELDQSGTSLHLTTLAPAPSVVRHEETPEPTAIDDPEVLAALLPGQDLQNLKTFIEGPLENLILSVRFLLILLS